MFVVVLNSEDLVLLEFYAPWFGHCKNLTSFRFRSVLEATVHTTIANQYQVRGFPTIKIFGKNKKSPTDYNGPRTAQGIIDAAFKELRNIVDSRVGGSSGGKSSSSGSGSGSSKDVVEVTDANFKEQVP